MTSSTERVKCRFASNLTVCGPMSLKHCSGAWQTWTRHDSVSTHLGPAVVQVITILPRFIIVNATGESLQCGQRNANHCWEIAARCQAPFFWEDAYGRQEMCIRPSKDSWNWSGAFEVFGLRSSQHSAGEY